MLTNNINTQNQQVTGQLAQTKSVGVAIALLLSVLTANLSAARSSAAIGNRSAAVASRTSASGTAATRATSSGTRGPSNSNVAKTQPAKTQTTKTQTAKTQPVQTQTAKTQPAKTQPVQTPTAKTQPAKTQPVQTPTAKTQPAKTQPVQTQTAKTQPAKTQPNNVLPTKTQPGKTYGRESGKVSPTRPPLGPDGKGRESNLGGRSGNSLVGQNHASRAIGGDSGTNRNRGGRIPDDRFRAQFGHDHSFRMDHAVMVGGRPHFWFGGFGFGILAPWPAGWLTTDAVYVDSMSGAYYLCNALHPGVLLALSVDDADDLSAAPAADSSAPAPLADAGLSDNTDSPAPASITRGQTPDQVVAALGNPTGIVDLGLRKIYVYNNMKVTFLAGRLSDVR